MTRLLSFFAAAVFAPAVVLAATIGQPAPDFRTTDIEGKAQEIAALKGRIVVLEWNNPECPFVKKHYDSKNMQKLQEKAAKDGVVWLTINSSAIGKQGSMEIEQAKKYVADQSAKPAGYILDHKGTIGKAYGASATPHMFVIAADGTLAYQGAIDDNNSANAADAHSAKNYVTAAVDALKAGSAPAVSATTAYGCGVKYAD